MSRTIATCYSYISSFHGYIHTHMNVLNKDSIMDIQELVKEMKCRQVKGHAMYFRPFSSEESAALRKYHEDHLQQLNKDLPIYTSDGELIASGFTRIVTGDYGAYIEFSPEQASKEIKPLFPGEPKRPVKYIWMIVGKMRLKVYYQVGRVSYADYKPGMYYVSPELVRQSISGIGK